MMKFLSLLLMGILSAWGAAPAEAFEYAASYDPAPLSRQLDELEHRVGSGRERDVDNLSRQVAAARGRATSCINRAEDELSRVGAEQALLGEPITGEAASVGEKRESLRGERLDAERRLSACRLLVLRSDDLNEQITHLQEQWLRQTLFQRGPDAWTLLRDNWTQPAIWFDATTQFLATTSGLERLTPFQYATLTLLAVVAFALSFQLRIKARRWAENRVVEASFTSRFSIAFLSVFGRYAPQWLTSSVVAAYLYAISMDTAPLPFITQVALGVPFYYLLLTMVYLFLAPKHPQIRLVPVETSTAAGLVRRLTVLMVVLFFGYLLFTTLVVQSLPESALMLARSFYSAALVINLIWIAHVLIRIPQLQRVAWVRPLFVIMLLAVLVVEWLGYRELSAFMMSGVFGSLILLGVFWVANRLLREFFDGLAAGERSWSQRARALFGLSAETRIPALGWMRVFVFITLLILLALGLLRMWGVPESGLISLATGGFSIGSLSIVPARIAIALVIFATLLFLNGWFKARLTSHWLEKLPVERGARDTMATLSGYVGIAFAVLVALGVTGMDFSNLAIIAGALSVGIGFGLQNIVNNFVSGLILLFERPVRTGDWVSVGNTEGYVKKIRIRSTEIQTFDRAEVIVPNSDLISQQVTNFMLHDTRGRVKIPIGVAYGSDVYKVRDLLLKACSEHPLVITDDSAPAPKVLFRAFGDSSLDFELRCHISNIDAKMDVTSDLNFAINDLFREHNIEIPFPQRDIHIVNGRKGPAPLSERYKPTAHRIKPDQDSDD